MILDSLHLIHFFLESFLLTHHNARFPMEISYGKWLSIKSCLIFPCRKVFYFERFLLDCLNGCLCVYGDAVDLRTLRHHPS